MGRNDIGGGRRNRLVACVTSRGPARRDPARSRNGAASGDSAAGSYAAANSRGAAELGSETGGAREASNAPSRGDRRAEDRLDTGPENGGAYGTRCGRRLIQSVAGRGR